MTPAERIRSFIDTLFPNRSVIQLRNQLADAQKERDYFRARADRLELIVLNRPVAQPARTGPLPSPFGRKPFGVVVAEAVKQQQEKEKRDKEQRTKEASHG